IEEQNNEIFLIEDIIVEDLDKKVGEISYHYIHDFDHLIKLEEIRYNYICDLFEEENKEMLEDESLDIVDDDWFEFVSLANIEGIGSITLKELGINLERFTTEKL